MTNNRPIFIFVLVTLHLYQVKQNKKYISYMISQSA